jgi:hypothetical protein
MRIIRQSTRAFVRVLVRKSGVCAGPAYSENRLFKQSVLGPVIVHGV